MNDASPEAELLVESSDGVRILTINRPHRANSLYSGILDRMIDALDACDRDDDVGAVVITGAGSKVFCAGGDIKAVLEHDGALPRSKRNLFEVILEMRKPTIAALNGAAAGGGLEIALACDLRIAEEHATVLLPEAKRGMGAHFASIMLPRLIPRAIAMEMLYRGEPTGATEAARWGLFNRVVPTGEGKAAAVALAQQIAANAPLTLRRMKATATRSMGMPIAAALRLDEGPSPYESEDRIEGFRAFAEKRKPVWKGK